MVEIDGDFCTAVEEECLQWVCSDGTPGCPPNPTGRCGEYRKPSRCIGSVRHKHYCIDKYEYPNVQDQRPQSWLSWYDAAKLAKSKGKRLCTDSEWTMACEGEEMQPYPYGDGYVRDRTACNFDNSTLYSNEDGTELRIDVFSAKAPQDKTSSVLQSLLVPSGTMSRCTSPYGVHDMVGNIDEWVVNESGKPFVSGLKGGHVFGVRNACRPMTEVHGPTFAWYETGTRFCQDVL
jgi:formylglycine-generating enzyme required for sulfatase activity